METSTDNSNANEAHQASSARLIFGDLWEYDPAPETADPRIEAGYDLFIGGENVPPKSGEHFESINPANEKVISRIPEAGEADVNAAFQAADKAYRTVWSRMPGSERGKYLFRIARLLQDRAREFAVAETIDGGKPIRESRDFDLPMAAAHFFYHAGWADKLAYLAPGNRSAPLRRGGPDHPLELSPAHARLEDRAGPGRWKLCGSQTGRNDFDHRPEIHRDPPGSGTP